MSSSFHQSHHRSRDRADQNTTCCLPLPGQSVPPQQDKLGHTSCVLHISKFQPETATSPGCPSLPCHAAPPAPFCQLGFETFTQQTKHALFSVNTINRCKEVEIHESHLCHAGTGRSLPQQSRAGREDWRCAALGLLPQPFPRGTDFISDSVLVVLQHISPLNTQLETSLKEQKPRSKRNTNYCFDLDSYLGLSLLV